MSNSKGKDSHLIESRRQEQNASLQNEEMLLSKTEQKVNQQNENYDEKVFADSNYIKKQQLNIKDDVQDFKDLEEEIEKIKKIKAQYNEQKQQIDQLNKIVTTLKSQNKSLKLQKQSNRQRSQRKDAACQVEKNLYSKRSEQSPQYQNTAKGNIVNRSLKNKKLYNIENVGMQRFASPQGHRRFESHNMKDLINTEQYDIFKFDHETMLRNHQHNKKSVIASFVGELKQQLQNNERVLQQQKRAHRQTREKLQVYLVELAQMRALIDRQKNCEFLERENIQMKKQLQVEVQQRLLAEERLREKELILAQYQARFATRCSDFDRQLDKMDQIYFSLEKAFKL